MRTYMSYYMTEIYVSGMERILILPTEVERQHHIMNTRTRGVQYEKASPIGKNSIKNINSLDSKNGATNRFIRYDE